jgi:myo-inositol 2-dehydrogenase/D-chiro-inositol 1-dehydrogenase
MMDGEPVRIGLVGAGRMGRVHLRALQRADRVEVAGVAEPVASIREGLAAKQLSVHADADGLLAAGALDGVLIAAPSDRHPALVAKFVAAGVPVLCEKPLGVRVADTLAAATAAREGGVLLQVGYWRRYVPALRALRTRIRGGELGEIYQLSCMQWDREPPTDAFRAHSGGIAIDMAVHEIDQTRWLLGQEITWLTATAAGAPAREPESDPDAAVILAGLSGGSVATISVGRRFPVQDSCWVEVWGSSGYERIPFMWNADGEATFLDAMVAQAQSFALAISRSGPLEGASGEDAAAAMEAAQRATDSLRAGQARGQTPGVI